MGQFLNLKILTMTGWSLTVVFSLLLTAYNQRHQSFESARNIANANFDKEEAVRQWASTHGGVYVPVDMNRTPPSPYLSHIPERDVTTESGRELTLMNPAYMLRQMMDEYSGLYGVKGHITALEVLNPDNNPDMWEKKALETFRKDPSVKEVIELASINGKDHMRLIRPLSNVPDCLKCHSHQATYQNTVTAGGVSINVPMTQIYDLAINSFIKTFLMHFLFWSVGMLLFRLVFLKEKKAKDELHYFANFDSLTGLPNRHAYTKKIAGIIKSTVKKEKRLVLLFMDLDNFKTVNDSLGHTVGDMLLQKIAERLEHDIAGYTQFSRFGGDEFVFLFSDVESPIVVEEAAIKIHEALKKPFILNGYEVYTTVSIGISCFPKDAHDAETLLKNADVAMYDAKQSGRSQYSFYSTDMLELSTNRLILESELHKVLKNDELFLVYQPQVSLADGQLVGAEALIRWNHPVKGLISPVEFIPIAENNGLIMPIGRWIIEQACEQLARWQESEMSGITVSINISAKQLLHQNLYLYIEEAIEKNGIDSRLLELEITESVVMENILETVQILNKLKKLGVTIAIDDFGTGYSSLSYLKKLPIDKLKIDREFIKDIPHDQDDIVITGAIINFSKSLNLKVIAEGPETEEHIAFLQEHKCDIAQGFYYSKPLSAEDVEAFYHSHLS